MRNSSLTIFPHLEVSQDLTSFSEAFKEIVSSFCNTSDLGSKLFGSFNRVHPVSPRGPFRKATMTQKANRNLGGEAPRTLSRIVISGFSIQRSLIEYFFATLLWRRPGPSPESPRPFSSVQTPFRGSLIELVSLSDVIIRTLIRASRLYFIICSLEFLTLMKSAFRTLTHN